MPLSPPPFSEALATFQKGEKSDAKDICEQILASEPDHTDALHLSGLISFFLNDIPSAIWNIERSLALQPEQISAWNNLGNVYCRAEQYEKAADSYRKSIDLAPNHSLAWANLAAALRNLDELKNAMVAAQHALELDMENIGALNTIALIFLETGELEQAAKAYRACEKIAGPDTLAIHQNMFSPAAYSTVLIRLGRHEEAEKILVRGLKSNPDDAWSAHQLDALRGTQKDRLSEQAVKGTFDPFAEDFERTLKQLKYQAPEVLFKALQAALDEGEISERIVDLGCGTGLFGPMLATICNQLIGVDLSPKMLEKAAKKNIYQQLLEADLESYLEGEDDGSIDQITAADTLNYLGDLKPVFQQAFRTLRPGGHFVATVEKLPEDQGETPSMVPKLNISGRFSHPVNYINELIENSGFEVVSLAPQIIRYEAEVGVIGLFFVLKKP